VGELDELKNLPDEEKNMSSETLKPKLLLPLNINARLGQALSFKHTFRF
jgi:hypothetical protein